MRVLHWYSSFLHGGGVASAVRGIAAAQARNGGCVRVVAAEPENEPLYEPMNSLDAVDVMTWRPTSSVRIGSQQLRLIGRSDIARLRAWRPDVVHAHGEFNVDTLWVPRLFLCPVVVSPHGALHPVVLGKSHRFAKRAYLDLESHVVGSRIAAYHALTPMEQDHTKAIFPGAYVYCVPQGPNPSCRLLEPVDGPTLTGSTERVEQRTITFAAIGRLDVFTKGLDILLDAFAAAAARPDCGALQLVLVGPDWKQGRTWLEHRVRELGIADRVRFTGALPGHEVAAVLSRADAFVQLSRHEGFPLSVAEALGALKPSVLSNAIGTVSYPEIAALPHVRLVAPNAADAADALAYTAQRIRELTAAAAQRRDAVHAFFSWDHAAARHLEQYALLCSARPVGGMTA